MIIDPVDKAFGDEAGSEHGASDFESNSEPHVFAISTEPRHLTFNSINAGGTARTGSYVTRQFYDASSTGGLVSILYLIEMKVIC